jgi:prepilin signal peptidase PulO-like enzyme (type II secretory pathway)
MGWVWPRFEAVGTEQIILFAAIGLVIGSFLNVLIYRLPRMILREEEAEPLAFNLKNAKLSLPALPTRPAVVRAHSCAVLRFEPGALQALPSGYFCSVPRGGSSYSGFILAVPA